MSAAQCRKITGLFSLFYGALLLLAFLVEFSYSVKWLALTKTKFTWNETRHCPSNKVDRRRYGLTGSQVKLCRRHATLMPAIINSARATKIVCQAQFVDRRWNCSSIDFLPKTSPDLTKGTREQAYVYALSSAAIAHAVAKGCASGLVYYCPCGQLPTEAPNGDFKWQGCSDNVLYGVAVSHSFADAPWTKNTKKKKALTQMFSEYDEQTNSVVNAESGDAGGVLDKTPPRIQMNQHNNEVGRKISRHGLKQRHKDSKEHIGRGLDIQKVVQNSLLRKCKCHGISSSCTVKTCWKALPPLEEIGLKLKEKYLRATEVRQVNAHSLSFEPVALMGRVTEEDLIYIRKSPDYCTEDQRFGSIGTRGRLCNATEYSHSGCDSMCCGRGYINEEQEVIESCQCKYVHCCYVKCKECRYTVQRHYCK